MTVLGHFLSFFVSVICSLVLAVIASVESVKVKNKTRSFRFQGEVFWLTFFFAMVFFIYSGDLLL
jgi:hypothetical protein